MDYDLTTTYFVGHRCKLSAFGKGKAECHGRRQVLLGVLINDEGYPFKWDVFPGNTAEVKTLKRNINACKTRFGLDDGNVTLVFDRGIISDENGSLIEDAHMKYISALDRDQIPSCGATEKHGRGFKVKPQTIIKAYCDKTKIEDVFKNVKSFLNIRPLFVNTEAHVKAVYTICILAYFINRYLANKRKEIGDKDFLNSRELYAPFKDIDIATLEDSRTGRAIKKAVRLPSETRNLLAKIALLHLARPQ